MRSRDGTRIIENVIEQRVADRASEWFPEVAKTPTIRLKQLSSRPRCLLYVVSIGDGPQSPRVVAKIRRVEQGSGTGQTEGGRPRLSTGQLGVSELTALEYDGLRSLFATFGPSDSGFGAVRPLDHLALENTILMEYVDAISMRQFLLDQSRLSVHQWTARRADTGQVWHHAGAWLRIFQSSLSHESLPARQPTRVDVQRLFHAYPEFLATRLGAASVGDLAVRAAEVAAGVLPEQLSLAVGHGDYAPRNVFVLPEGRITVFDPLPRWAVPCYEDLCRFLVGVCLVGLQLHTHGAAYGRAELERREQAVIEGYYAGGEVPFAQLRCYQLLIMLDKWSALVDSTSSGWSGRIRAKSIDSATGYLRKEAQRLLDLASSGSS